MIPRNKNLKQNSTDLRNNATGRAIGAAYIHETSYNIANLVETYVDNGWLWRLNGKQGPVIVTDSSDKRPGFERNRVRSALAGVRIHSA